MTPDEILDGPWPPRSDVWWIARVDGEPVCPGSYTFEYGGMEDEPCWDCDGYDHIVPTEYIAERMVLVSAIGRGWVYESRRRTFYDGRTNGRQPTANQLP